MGFDQLFRDGIATLDELTQDLQPTVLHRAFQSDNGRGGNTHDSGTPRKCVIDFTVKQRPRADGTMLNVVATLIFPRPVAVNLRDIFVLPDGTTPPSIDAPGIPIDPTTNQAFALIVMLGELIGG